jgi:hypothetical protein
MLIHAIIHLTVGPTGKYIHTQCNRLLNRLDNRVIQPLSTKFNYYFVEVCSDKVRDNRFLAYLKPDYINYPRFNRQNIMINHTVKKTCLSQSSTVQYCLQFSRLFHLSRSLYSLVEQGFLPVEGTVHRQCNNYKFIWRGFQQAVQTHSRVVHTLQRVVYSFACFTLS